MYGVAARTLLVDAEWACGTECARASPAGCGASAVAGFGMASTSASASSPAAMVERLTAMGGMVGCAVSGRAERDQLPGQLGFDHADDGAADGRVCAEASPGDEQASAGRVECGGEDRMRSPREVRAGACERDGHVAQGRGARVGAASR